MIVDLDTTIVTVSVRSGKIRVVFKDEREVSMPVRWFPRLVAATPTQRRKVEIVDDGRALHWSDVDEDISVSAFLAQESIVTFPPGSLLIADDDSLRGDRTRA